MADLRNTPVLPCPFIGTILNPAVALYSLVLFTFSQIFPGIKTMLEHKKKGISPFLDLSPHGGVHVKSWEQENLIAWGRHAG